MGPELMQQFRDQAERFGARLETDDVTAVELSPDGGLHKVWVGDDLHLTRTRDPGDGRPAPQARRARRAGALRPRRQLLRDLRRRLLQQVPTIIVGGGDSAMEEAMFLAKFASKVAIVHRRDEFRASKIMLERARAIPNIEWLTPYVVEEFVAGRRASSLAIAQLRNTGDGSTRELRDRRRVHRDRPRPAVAAGRRPGRDSTTDGYVVTQGRSTLTNLPGVFAAGDLVDHTYRQAITAAGSGCQAALDAEWYLRDTPLGFDAMTDTAVAHG